MAKKALVTGCLGNLGCYVTERLLSEGYHIIGIDNDTRGRMLGASVIRSVAHLASRKNFYLNQWDIRDPLLEQLIKASKFDLIVHCAAQVSHPHSIDVPVEDFEINAHGTLRLLEYVRRHSDDSIFIHVGSAKIYGENVDAFPEIALPSRYDYDGDFNGISESCSFDRTVKTPFGASKAYADLIAQEYGMLYGLKTVVLRPSCFVGKYTVPSLLQRWEAWIMLNILKGEPVRIFGYKGKQVRDILHCEDLVNAIMLMIANLPKKGDVFNIGGGRNNSLSVLECIELVKEVTRLSPKDIIYDEKRPGDWRVYITDNSKLIRHYPNWHISWDLGRIFIQLYQNLVKLVEVSEPRV